MHINIDKFMYNMRDEINAHGIYMANKAFPWCDTFEFYSRVAHSDDYESSFPYYHDHRDQIHNHLNKLASSLGWEETLEDFCYVKGTDKGIHIPNRCAAIIFALDSNVKLMTHEKQLNLLYSIAIYDYALFNYKSRGIIPLRVKKGAA